MPEGRGLRAAIRMIQLVTSACLLSQHDACSGYTHEHLLTATEQPCLCPCHLDTAHDWATPSTRFAQFVPMTTPDDGDCDDEEPRYERARPAGLRGANDARRLLLVLALAALLYLALCTLSSAVANAAAPILHP